MHRAGLSVRGRSPGRVVPAPRARNPAMVAGSLRRAPLPRLSPQWRARLFRSFRRLIAGVAVSGATLLGGYLVLVGYHDTHQLTVGEIRMSVSPGHRGALDVYVPLVDWGARFESIRLPVRLRGDLQTVSRDVVTDLARGGKLNVEQARAEARDALASYLKKLIAWMMVAGLALGVLVAFAIRSRVPRLRWTIPCAVITAVAMGVAM